MATRAPNANFTINPIQNTKEDLETTTTLFKAYALSLNIDLTFQNFTTELSNLPNPYTPPNGTLLLARSLTSHTPLGCIALRSLPTLGPSVCEMKRLYVDPAGRGTGIGRALVEAVISEARKLGYERIVLDTLKKMEAARKLYREMGFEEMEKYYETPLEGETVFLGLWL